MDQVEHSEPTRFIPALSTIQSLASTIPEETLDDKGSRSQLLEAAKDLVLSLERPDDVVERVCFQLIETTVIRTAVDLGIFKLLAGGDVQMTAEEIATATGTDQLVIQRLMRCLAAWAAVRETDRAHYAASVATLTFANPRNVAALETWLVDKPPILQAQLDNLVCLSFDLLSPAWLKLPEHLRDLEYRSPTDKLNTTLAKANGVSNKSVAQIIYEGPYLRAFGIYMKTFSQGRARWVDIYPVRKRLIDGFDRTKGDTIMVDVGGGFGQQAQLLKDNFPNLPGRIVVQNLPLLPQTIPDIEFVEHDFWTPQPIKGARLYYLRLVVHDFDRARNLVLLGHLRAAMLPGYSRLVINDWIMPERRVPRFMAAQDINMMALAGEERTEAQLRELLTAAGLKVTSIFAAEDGVSEGVVEAVVAE